MGADKVSASGQVMSAKFGWLSARTRNEHNISFFASGQGSIERDHLARWTIKCQNAQ